MPTKRLSNVIVARTRLAVVAGLACSACLLGLATPASALVAYSHPFLGSFDGTGSVGPEGATGPFSQPTHIAVDDTDGTVYVADEAYGVVDKFSAAGAPLPFSGLAPGVTALKVGSTYSGGLTVDNSGAASRGRIYTASQYPSLIRAFSPAGTEITGPHLPFSYIEGNCGPDVDPAGNLWLTNPYFGVQSFTSDGVPIQAAPLSLVPYCRMAIDGSTTSGTGGYMYIVNGFYETPTIAFSPDVEEKFVLDREPTADLAVDSGTDDIYLNHRTYITEFAPGADAPGPRVSTFGKPDPSHGFPDGLSGSSYPFGGIAVNGVTHTIYVVDGTRVVMFGAGEPMIVPTVTTNSADTTRISAVLHGHVDADGGGDTTECYFEWGLENPESKASSYGNVAPCQPGGPIHNADGSVAVSAEISGLEPSVIYHYRLVASNAEGSGFGPDKAFQAESPPVVSDEYAFDVKSDGATIRGTVDPNGGNTTYRFEFGLDTNYGSSLPVPDGLIESSTQSQVVTSVLTGLAPATPYHYRLVGINGAGTTPGPDHMLTTYPSPPAKADACANAQVRQEVGAFLLPDCRAYELTSAQSAGGYDVESNLVPGQTPLPALPDADDRLLYALHSGTIPGVAGHPTNFGLDPYVATRTEIGWKTAYVGISAIGTPSPSSFGSPLGEASSDLSTFAFSGPHLCSPCFADGSTGIPVRRSDGTLVQGMSGAFDPGQPATQSGYVGRYLSADGVHLIFSSTSKFESDGNSNGDNTVYDRNLATGVTHVVSKTPGGATMTGAGIGALDLSQDGSRVLVGQAVAQDSRGNTYWHIFMNVGDSPQTSELSPAGGGGVLYDGMTADGSKVFFTTGDSLTGADGDNSPDVYMAAVAPDGSVTVTLVSSDDAGDACAPAGNSVGARWNNVAGDPDCGAVAFAGGGGVASQSGAFLFLSPEVLDGQGTAGQPNVYLTPVGGEPHFVATLAPDDPAVRDAASDNEVRRYSDVQVTPSGSVALFSTSRALADFQNLGHQEIYRFDSTAESLECVSCASSGAAAFTDTVLSSTGLNLADDGRVFFTSTEQLALRDTNKHKDVYEWENGEVELISSGTGSGSGLFSVSSDGRDIFFFTREVLTRNDRNGSSMKIYDARAGGGFRFEAQALPCQASDECHGPGTQAAPHPQIGTFEGKGGNAANPPAKRHKPHRHHKRRHHKRHHRHQHGAQHPGPKRGHAK